MIENLLFLSHSSVDRDLALRLAEKLESNGLKVWIAYRDAVTGSTWQDQIEEAISLKSTAFLLLLTKSGVKGWVKQEVRVAMDRAIQAHRTERVYPFIPALLPGVDPDQLPPFARQFQGVQLDESLEHVDAVLAAINSEMRAIQKITLLEPFVGLSAFNQEDAPIFFGRREEAQRLVDQARSGDLVIVVGDSGSGKSSLVQAGLIPAYREGGLSEQSGRRLKSESRHVLQMRPADDPFEQLVEATHIASEGLQIQPEILRSAWSGIRARSSASVCDSLRMTSPAGAEILLVIDQFEELWTLCSMAYRQDFLRFLLSWMRRSDPARRLVATMRSDYFHLLSESPEFPERLANPRSKFFLSALTPEGLWEAIVMPLSLAGVGLQESESFARVVLQDVTGQPGESALLELALTEAWRLSGGRAGALLSSYLEIGRVHGALSCIAERALENPHSDPLMVLSSERDYAVSLLLRLVRLDDFSRATRRVVYREDLLGECWAVAEKLASKHCGRLVTIRSCHRSAGLSNGLATEPEMTVELSHEQVAYQWPRYRNWLLGSPCQAKKKILHDRLVDQARRWSDGGKLKSDLETGGDLVRFEEITAVEPTWLGPREREYLRESRLMRSRKRQRSALYAALTVILMGVLLLLFEELNRQEIAGAAAEHWSRLEISTGVLDASDRKGLRSIARDERKEVRAEFLIMALSDEVKAERFSRAANVIARAAVGLDQEVAIQVLKSAKQLPASNRASILNAQIKMGTVIGSPYHLDWLISSLDTLKDPELIWRVGEGLMELVRSASGEEGRGLLPRILASSRRFPKGAPQRVSLALPVSDLAFSGCVPEGLAEECLNLIIEAVSALQDSRRAYQFGYGLSALKSATSSKSGSIAEATMVLIDGISSTHIDYEIAELAAGLDALSVRVPPDQRPRVSRAVVDALLAVKDSAQMTALDSSLSGLSHGITLAEFHQESERLLNEIGREEPAARVASFCKAVCLMAVSLGQKPVVTDVSKRFEGLDLGDEGPSLVGASLCALALFSGEGAHDADLDLFEERLASMVSLPFDQVKRSGALIAECIPRAGLPEAFRQVSRYAAERDMRSFERRIITEDLLLRVAESMAGPDILHLVEDQFLSNVSANALDYHGAYVLAQALPALCAPLSEPASHSLYKELLDECERAGELELVILSQCLVALSSNLPSQSVLPLMEEVLRLQSESQASGVTALQARSLRELCAAIPPSQVWRAREILCKAVLSSERLDQIGAAGRGLIYLPAPEGASPGGRGLSIGDEALQRIFSSIAQADSVITLSWLAESVAGLLRLGSKGGDGTDLEGMADQFLLAVEAGSNDDSSSAGIYLGLIAIIPNVSAEVAKNCFDRLLNLSSIDESDRLFRTDSVKALLASSAPALRAAGENLDAEDASHIVVMLVEKINESQWPESELALASGLAGAIKRMTPDAVEREGLILKALEDSDSYSRNQAFGIVLASLGESQQLSLQACSVTVGRLLAKIEEDSVSSSDIRLIADKICLIVEACRRQSSSARLVLVEMLKYGYVPWEVLLKGLGSEKGAIEADSRILMAQDSLSLPSEEDSPGGILVEPAEVARLLLRE
ncbi:MAG: toll/interleukin-1 receptor domain-containing protein [Planctomycetota bacterium]